MSTDTIEAFLAHLREYATKHGVELLLSEQPQVLYPGSTNVLASGFFVITPRPKLAVGMGWPDGKWLEVLVHESCHMDQWVGNCQAWQDNFLSDGREAVDWINDWCEGRIELNKEELSEIIRRAKNVELDCEKRTIEKIKRWNLGVDTQEYAQRGNAYVHFYDIVGQTRKWNEPGQAPYEIEQVWRSAPRTLVDSPNEELLDAYHRQYVDTPRERTRSLKPA